MALARFVITSAVTVPAGTPATVTAGEPETGGAAGYGNTGTSAGYAAFPQSFQPGTPIVLMDLPSRTSRGLVIPPGMVPGPSAVRDQLARRVAGWRT